jgi:hypothetical protein
MIIKKYPRDGERTGFIFPACEDKKMKGDAKCRVDSLVRW